MPRRGEVGGRVLKMIMEITLLIMEKSWKNHGILFLNFCGNPAIGMVSGGFRGGA